MSGINEAHTDTQYWRCSVCQAYIPWGTPHVCPQDWSQQGQTFRIGISGISGIGDLPSVPTTLDLQQRINALAARVQSLEAQVAELDRQRREREKE